MTKVIESHPELDQIIREFKTETVAEEALRILKAKPEYTWCINERSDRDGRYCALGHYSQELYNHPGWGRDGAKTSRLIKASNLFMESNGCTIAAANNGLILKYRQPTPKQRVVALLQDMIKAGY